MRYILTFLLTLLCLASQAQLTTVTGIVRDATTRQALPGAVVAELGYENGTLTDAKGRFTLQCVGQTPRLRVSYIGYQPREFKVTTPNKKMLVYLGPDDIELQTTTITDSRLQRVHPDKKKHIFDYAFLDGNVAMILRAPRAKRNHIELRTLDGQELDVYDDMPEAPRAFYTDCMGILHYLSKSFAWQLDFEDGILVPQPDSLHQFQAIVQPCTAELDSTYYFALFPSTYVRQFIYVRSVEMRRRHLYASVDQRAGTTFQDEARMPSKIVSPHLLRNKARPEYNATELNQTDLERLFFKPPYVPLKIVQDQAIVFDHLNKKIVKFNPEGRKIGEVPIKYPTRRHWKRSIITDEAKTRAFAHYEKNGITTLAQIDPETGELGQQWELPKQFIQNIKVRKGYIYFLYKDSMYDPVQKLYRYDMFADRE